MLLCLVTLIWLPNKMKYYYYFVLSSSLCHFFHYWGQIKLEKTCANEILDEISYRAGSITRPSILQPIMLLTWQSGLQPPLNPKRIWIDVMNEWMKTCQKRLRYKDMRENQTEIALMWYKLSKRKKNFHSTKWKKFLFAFNFHLIRKDILHIFI